MLRRDVLRFGVGLGIGLGVGCGPDGPSDASLSEDPMGSIALPAGAVPICLSDTISLAPGARGAPLDAQKMAPMARVPYLIEEIRFRVAGVAATDASPAVTVGRSLGGSIRVKLQLGQHLLTGGATASTQDGRAGYVPIWSFGRATHLNAERSINGTFAAYRTFGYFRWILDRPLFVPPGASILCQLAREATDGWQTQSASGTTPIRVAYCGHALPANTPIPALIDVPYVAAFIDDSGNSAVGYSGESDLKNPFTRPLDVYRLTGRLRYYLSSTAHDFDYLSADYTASVLGTRVQIRKGQMDVVPNFTPFNEVFSIYTRTLEFQDVLGVGANYSVQTRKTAPSSPGAGTLTPMVAMIGSRQEAP